MPNPEARLSEEHSTVRLKDGRTGTIRRMPPNLLELLRGSSTAITQVSFTPDDSTKVEDIIVITLDQIEKILNLDNSAE